MTDAELLASMGTDAVKWAKQFAEHLGEPGGPLHVWFANAIEAGKVQDMTTPSIGRIVHYTSYGTPGGEYTQECRAAVITALSGIQAETDDCVSLCVLNPTGVFFDQHVEHSEEEFKGGTWHWPERV